MQEKVAGPVLLDAHNKHAFVAGAAGGIGRATVDLFRAAGAVVSGADSAPADPGWSDELAYTAAMDATNEAAVAKSLAAAVEISGPIDFLVNAVGIAGHGPVTEMALADWQRIMEVNLASSFLLAREAYAHLRRPGAAVVFLSSSNGRNGGTLYSGAAYGAAKAGILNLARHLAREWAAHGVRVNCVAPGPVATPMLDRLSASDRKELMATIPLGRYAQANEVAAAIGFLCSEHARSMTGTVVNISGGLVLD